jgi:hypothetical protein
MLLVSRCGTSVAVTSNPVIVPDRELEKKKKPGESEPPLIRCPLCGWSQEHDVAVSRKPLQRGAEHIAAKAGKSHFVDGLRFRQQGSDVRNRGS